MLYFDRLTEEELSEFINTSIKAIELFKGADNKMSKAFDVMKNDVSPKTYNEFVNFCIDNIKYYCHNEHFVTWIKNFVGYAKTKLEKEIYLNNLIKPTVGQIIPRGYTVSIKSHIDNILKYDCILDQISDGMTRLQFNEDKNQWDASVAPLMSNGIVCFIKNNPKKWNCLKITSVKKRCCEAILEYSEEVEKEFLIELTEYTKQCTKDFSVFYGAVKTIKVEIAE